VGLGAGGRFLSTPIPVDAAVTARVVAAGEDHRSELPPAVVPGIRPGTDDLVIVLVDGVWIEGIVRSADGASVEGLAVRVDPASGGDWSSGPTDSGGRFRIPVAGPGRYVLRVFRQRLLAGPVEVDAPSDAVEIRLPGTAIWRGRLVLPAGVGTDGVAVRIFPESAPERIAATARPRADGTWEAEVRGGEGGVRVEAVGGGVYGTATAAGPGEEVVVTAAPALTIEGCVIGADGAPRAGPPDRAIVTATGAKRISTARAVVGEDGRFALTGLPAGEYDLVLRVTVRGERRTAGRAAAVAAGSRDVEILQEAE
jgi:hypothetical protein